MKIGNGVELEPTVLEYIRSHETLIKAVLGLYYTKFTGTGDGVTFHAACHKKGMNPSYVIDYMAMYGLGMPDTKDEAKTYLKKLTKI